MAGDRREGGLKDAARKGPSRFSSGSAQGKRHLQAASKLLAGISPNARRATTQCCTCLCTRDKPALRNPFNKSQAAGAKGNADVPWSSCFLHIPSPQIHCTKKAVEKPIPTSAKEKRLKSARNCNHNILSFKATTKAVSLCLLPYQVPCSKQIFLGNTYSWGATAELSAVRALQAHARLCSVAYANKHF